MPRGVKAPVDLNPEIGRRQLFSIAVKYGLTEQDVQGVCDQIMAINNLVDQWHKLEAATMTDFMAHRNGESLAELAERASDAAWEHVAALFSNKFPGYVATLIKGVVRIQEA